MLKLSLKEGEYVNIGDNIRVVYAGGSGKNAEGRLFKRKYGAFGCEIKRMPSICLSGGHFFIVPQR